MTRRTVEATGDSWLCPACKRPFTVFYGIDPRCLDCWIADHPDDPYTKRILS